MCLCVFAASSDPEKVPVHQVPLLWRHQNPPAMGQQYPRRQGGWQTHSCRHIISWIYSATAAAGPACTVMAAVTITKVLEGSTEVSKASLVVCNLFWLLCDIFDMLDCSRAGRGGQTVDYDRITLVMCSSSLGWITWIQRSRFVCFSVWEAAVHQFPGGNEKNRGVVWLVFALFFLHEVRIQFLQPSRSVHWLEWLNK